MSPSGQTTSFGPYIPPATRAGDLVLLGSHTPHDRATGRLIVGTADLSAPISDQVRSKVLFSEVAFGGVKAQTRQVLENMKLSLEVAGSSIEHVAHLRIFVSDIGMEGVVLGVVRSYFGDKLSSGELIEAVNAGCNSDIHVQMDCIALSVEAGTPKNLWAPGLEALTAPFPTATKAGAFLFTSQFGGANAKSGDMVRSPTELSSAMRERIEPLLKTAPKKNSEFLIQQAALWDNILTVLDAARVPPSAILYHMNWMRPSMRVFSDGSITRSIMDLTGEYLLTCFPTSGLRAPDAQLEGRVVAILPESGLKKSVRVPIHGISNSYYGMIGVGHYLFGSGEVPVDTVNFRLIDEMQKLPPPLQSENFGKIYRESPIQSQAHYVYSLWKRTLEAYGSSMGSTVHQTVYLTEAGDGPALEGVMRAHFPTKAPATTLVPIVGASPFKNARLELEVTAYLSDH